MILVQHRRLLVEFLFFSRQCFCQENDLWINYGQLIAFYHIIINRYMRQSDIRGLAYT